MAIEKSFKRAALFGVLGALIALIVSALICGFLPGMKQFPLFKVRPLTLNLIIIVIQLHLNLFVLVGFVAGWAYCLFRGGLKKGDS
jgi:hypothetical protein